MFGSLRELLLLPADIYTHAVTLLSLVMLIKMFVVQVEAFLVFSFPRCCTEGRGAAAGPGLSQAWGAGLSELDSGQPLPMAFSDSKMVL